jgi:lactate racemase
MAALAAPPEPPAGVPVAVREGDSPEAVLGEWTCGDAVTIAVNDHTRPVDPSAALTALFARLTGPRCVVVGLGLHRPERPDELSVISRFDPVQHDPDDSVPVGHIGGIAARVAVPVAQAAWSISVGVVELHQYAGVSGGHKGVVVGCGGRQTIAALHHRDRITMPQVEVGRVEGNPFRQVIDRIGRAARCRLAVVYVPALGRWMAGDPTLVVAEAARRLDPWYSVPGPVGGAVLRVPASKGLSLYQASRAATYLAMSPRCPVARGGALVIDAALPEGLGSEAGFVAALQREGPPWGGTLSGPAPTGAGAQRAVLLALLAQRYRLVLRGCQRPDELRALGFDASAEPAVVEPGWVEVLRPFERLPQLGAVHAR